MSIEAAIARWEDEGEEAWRKSAMITDEMVKKAWEAYDRDYAENMRAALEAVAPQLIAQGMREADKIYWKVRDCHPIRIREAIHARAQELDQK